MASIEKTAAAASRRCGFTLVEVIVVAVIVLILSAVAIPMYNGFVKQARLDALANLAETGAAAANSYWRKTETMGVATATNQTFVTDVLKLYYDENKFTVTITGDGTGADCSKSTGNPPCTGSNYVTVTEKGKDTDNTLSDCACFK